MEKNRQNALPEIVFGSGNQAQSKAISRLVKAGKLRKLASRVYTSNLKDSPEFIIRRHVFDILGHLYEGAVVSHRSAIEGGLASDNSIVLTYSYNKRIKLPGLIVKLTEGPGAQAGDTPFLGGLFMASRARAYLENLSPSRRSGKLLPKTLTREDIESHLEKFCRLQGEVALNRLRDEARNLAKPLQLEKEFKKLDELIGSLLGSKTAGLKHPTAKARAKGEPFDSERVELFMALYQTLRQTELPKLSDHLTDQEKLLNLSFFEAYFSNYIEGTRFEIQEASDIIFHHKEIPLRADDAHDVIGTFQIVSDMEAMRHTPDSFNELVELLTARHNTLMSAHPDKLPGYFKEKPNVAGNTQFVSPECVMGTLRKGFELYQSVEPGLARAMFIMFVVTEVHPFADGNGRIARIMMNAELTAQRECRIIIPNVYREDYLLALRRLSRQKDSEVYLNMLLRAQQFTHHIDFSDYDIALQQIRQCNAFCEPHEGVLRLF